MKKIILVVGGKGFVGSTFLTLSKSYKNKIISPPREELDITNKKNVLSFFKRVKPEFVINFAAYTNLDESEKERGNLKGKTWITNVIGVRNLVSVCKKLNVFFIQISTDAVFPGTKEYPGPYKESSNSAKDEKTINWYGVSKLHAEREVEKLKKNFSILRISHPFGNPKNQRDLVAKTIRDIENKRAIFKDQLFTPTFIEDLTAAIWAIKKKKTSGIFHVSCKDLVPRNEFDLYLIKLLKLNFKLIEGSMEEFLKYSFPRSRLGGLLTDHTQEILGIKFHTWQQALKKTVRKFS